MISYTLNYYYYYYDKKKLWKKVEPQSPVDVDLFYHIPLMSNRLYTLIILLSNDKCLSFQLDSVRRITTTLIFDFFFAWNNYKCVYNTLAKRNLSDSNSQIPTKFFFSQSETKGAGNETKLYQSIDMIILQSLTKRKRTFLSKQSSADTVWVVTQHCRLWCCSFSHESIQNSIILDGQTLSKRYSDLFSALSIKVFGVEHKVAPSLNRSSARV